MDEPIGSPPPCCQADHSFVCPRDLFTEWEKHAPTALAPGSRWHVGDLDPTEYEGKVLQRRAAPGICQSIYYLTGRAFRMINIEELIIAMAVLVLVAVVLSIGSIVGEFTWGGLPQRLNGTQVYRRTDRQAGRQTDRQTDR